MFILITMQHLKLLEEAEVHQELQMLYFAELEILLKSGDGNINNKITKFALNALNVDEHGLDDMDNRILSTIIEKFKGAQLG